MISLQLFTHFIITRFNVVDWDGYEVSYDYVNSDEYLTERFRIFDTYCFPSVSQQINKNFRWLILFNDRLPEKWVNEVEKYRERFSNIEIVYLPAIQNNNRNQHLNKLILERLQTIDTNYQYILTTRIDNDDAIHISFIESIQNYFLTHTEEALINYSNGLQFIPEEGILKHITNPKSHFSTLIEKYSAKIRTVLAFSHVELPKDIKSVCLIGKEPMWLEVIHSTNVVNTCFFQIRNLFKDLFLISVKYKNLESFGVNKSIAGFNTNVWKIFFKWLLEKIVFKTKQLF